MPQGFDCATPLTQDIATAFVNDGNVFVARYLTPSGWKKLTRSEAEIITAAGLQIVSVFETTANRAAGGAPNGHTDGALALSLAQELGQPVGSTIYFAVDFDTNSFDVISAYLRAASTHIVGYDTGVYGSYGVVEAMKDSGACSKFWQTYAWSRGNKSESINIYQYDCGPTGQGFEKNGIGVDLDESFGNEGWWNTIVQTIEEDVDNMPMKLEDWQWEMLYKVMGDAYNKDQLTWNWEQKIVDRTLTASELAFLNTVLDGRIDRKIEV
jgi:hypothetical protein